MRTTKKLPLFIVSGASGVGKTSACEALFRNEKDYIVMESDLLWDEYYNTPEDGYRKYRKMWMNMCASISQIGKPVVLCGCATPDQFEALPERALFSEIHYIALVCAAEELERRMREGRGISDKCWISSSLSFNEWLKVHGAETSPAMELIDTTRIIHEEAARRLHEWLMKLIEDK